MAIKLHYHRHLLGGYNRRPAAEHLINISFRLFGEVIDHPVGQCIKPCEIGMSDMYPQPEPVDLCQYPRGRS